MAPEVFRQQPYNEKADIFSFGVLMYEVFGRRSLVSMVCCCSGGTHKEVCALFHPSIHHDPFYQSISSIPVESRQDVIRCHQPPSDIVPAYPFPSCPQTSTDIQACSEGCRRLPTSDSELLGPELVRLVSDCWHQEPSTVRPPRSSSNGSRSFGGCPKPWTGGAREAPGCQGNCANTVVTLIPSLYSS